MTVASGTRPRHFLVRAARGLGVFCIFLAVCQILLALNHVLSRQPRYAVAGIVNGVLCLVGVVLRRKFGGIWSREFREKAAEAVRSLARVEGPTFLLAQLQIESGWSDVGKRAATAFLLRHGTIEILQRPGGKDVVVVRRFVETS